MNFGALGKQDIPPTVGPVDRSSSALASDSTHSPGIAAHAAKSLRYRFLLPPGILRRVASGTAWVAAGTALGQCLKLVGFLGIARILTKSEYGQLGIVQNTVNMLGIFATMGLGVTTSKFVGQLRLDQPKRAGAIIALAGVVSLASATTLGALACFLAGPVARLVLSAPALAPELRVGSVLLVATAFNAVQAGTLMGLNAFHRAAALAVLQGLLTLLGGCVGAFYGGVFGVLIGLTGAALASSIPAWRWIAKESVSQGIPVVYRLWRSEKRVLWEFALPSLATGVFTTPALWLVQTALVRQRGGFDELALFSVAFQWRIVVLFLPQVLSSVVLPLFAELRANSRGGERHTSLFVVSSLAPVVVVFSMLIGVLAPHIMSAYGESYQNGAPVLLLVVGGAAVSAINGLVATALVSADRMWRVTLANASWSAVAILLARWWVPVGGARGLASALLAAEVVLAAIVVSVWIRELRSPGQTPLETTPDGVQSLPAAPNPIPSRVP